jgi:hypothetical protein
MARSIAILSDVRLVLNVPTRVANRKALLQSEIAALTARIQ